MSNPAHNFALPLTRDELRPSPGCETLLRTNAERRFPGARSAIGALVGVALQAECWEAAHQLAQDLTSVEGAYWHGILHRMEPDSFNANYWFRRVGSHPIFPALQQRAATLAADLDPVPDVWNPAWFVALCDETRASAQPSLLAVVRAIHNAECQLLFAYCLAAHT